MVQDMDACAKHFWDWQICNVCRATELERMIYPERFALAELPDQVKPTKEGEATEDETEQDGAPRKPPPPTQDWLSV
eukprot:s6_g2.t1